jgi:hypothetical protein
MALGLIGQRLDTISSGHKPEPSGHPIEGGRAQCIRELGRRNRRRSTRGSGFKTAVGMAEAEVFQL